MYPCPRYAVSRPSHGRMQMRPWEPTGMTTERWLLIPLRRVALATLIPSHGTREEWVKGPSTSWCGDPHPHVVVWQGRSYLSDGHHRVARARRQGHKTMWVRVLEHEG